MALVHYRDAEADMREVAHMPGTTTFAERRKALDDALREVCVFNENTLQALREKARCAERYMQSADLPRPAARALVAALLAFGGAHAE